MLNQSQRNYIARMMALTDYIRQWHEDIVVNKRQFYTQEDAMEHFTAWLVQAYKDYEADRHTFIEVFDDADVEGILNAYSPSLN